jgi:hypothetical protein
MRWEGRRQSREAFPLDRKRQSPEAKNSWVQVASPIQPKVRPFSPEWFALKYLKNWTPEDVELAIKKGIQLDLGPLWSHIEDAIFQELLGWFRLRRPDIAAVLETPEGERWVKDNLRRNLARTGSG